MTVGGSNDWHKDAGFKGAVVSGVQSALIELDVNNNGSLGDAVDGIANYLPGYSGSTAVLTKTAVQEMKIIVQGLAENTAYNFRTFGTTERFGIASNAASTANYASTVLDNDFVLIKADTTSEEDDNTDVSVTTDANGVAVVGIRARDFGGQTTIVVKNGAGVTGGYNATAFPKTDEAYACALAHEITHLLIDTKNANGFDGAEHTINPDSSDPAGGLGDWACLMFRGIVGRPGATRANREFATVKFFPVVQVQMTTKTGEGIVL